MSSQQELNFTSAPLRFDGSDYSHEQDDARLSVQIKRIFAVMSDQRWRTLSEIEAVTNDPPTSISAQLRNLRKARFGGHTVNKRHRGEPKHGLYEYQLIANERN